MSASLMLRTGAFLAAAVTLGGCNLVVSPTPVFTAADAAGAPPLRTGVWAGPEPDCKFDEAAPAADWPKCANGSIITPSEAKGIGAEAKPSAYVLAAGDPRILQAAADFSAGGDASVKQNGQMYFFLAFEPLGSDAEGRIVKAQAWFIQCGPPPAPHKGDSGKDIKPEDFVTKHPLPGLKVDGGMCTPADKAAVRGAARASRAWADQLLQTHWVRDGSK